MQEDDLDPKEAIRSMHGNLNRVMGEGRASFEALINLAINLWRLENEFRYLKLADESPDKNRLDRHLTALKDSLAKLGFKYKDHTGDRVPDTGEYALKVIEYIPKEGITHDSVIQTIKPSVYHHEKMVIPGEVLVGIPVSNENGENKKFASFVNRMLDSIVKLWKRIPGRKK